MKQIGLSNKRKPDSTICILSIFLTSENYHDALKILAHPLLITLGKYEPPITKLQQLMRTPKTKQITKAKPKMKRIHVPLMILPLLWWLPELSAKAGAHFSLTTSTSAKLLPEPFFILLLGVVLLVTASGFRVILGKKRDSGI